MMFSARLLVLLFALMGAGQAAAQFGIPLGSGLPQQPAAPKIEQVDRIVAVVNEDVIMNSELEAEMYQVVARLRRQQVELPPASVVRKQVLERLVMQQLQLQAARASGVVVDDDILNRTISKIARDNNLTLDQLRMTLESEGYSFAAYREELRKQFTLKRLQQREVVNRITVSDQEVQHFLDVNRGAAGGRSAYHLGHIMIAVPEAPSPEQVQAARAKAEEVLAALQAGADFRETAIAESDGRSALEGGDLGWREAAQVPSIFADAVSGMEIGEISDIIRSPGGFHIVKLLDARGGERRLVNQTNARHILVRTDQVTSNEQAQLRLRQLRDRVEAGEDFAALARSNSDDSASAINGGELGWTNPGDMVPEFEDAMNELQPGEVSQPFRTQFGWHIVQVLERRQHDSTDAFRQAKAREQLLEAKTEEETAIWLRRLRDEAYVEYRLEE